jgi:predicted  nucleic acid-binding Zn-ribbon protein
MTLWDDNQPEKNTNDQQFSQLDKEIKHYKQNVETQRKVIIKLSDKVAKLQNEVNERRFKGINDKTVKSKV